MKSLSSFQLFPIVNDQEFEAFVCDIFNGLDKTTSYELFGRKGQKQHGIDIFSTDKQTVIQCKHKLIDRPDQKIREELIEDFNIEINNFKSFNESHDNHFKTFIVASTFKNDTHLSGESIRLSKLHNIRFEYWSWNKLISNVGEEIIQKYYDYFRKSLALYYSDTTSKESQIPIESDLPYLNQLYNFLSIRFRDINVLHSKMFIHDNVFKNQLNDYSSRRVFTYKTYNEELFSLLEPLQFENNALMNTFGDDSQQFHMFDFITKTLCENGIETISGKKYGQVKSIINRKSEQEDYFDNFEKFMFIDTLRSLPQSKSDNSLEEILRQGYFYYKFGDLLKSKDLFQRASIKAVKENKKISYLIAQHNLLHLSKFIEWGYFDLPEKYKIVKELKEINLEDIEVDSIDFKIKEIIVSRSFFTSAKDSIQSYTKKVEEMYHSYLRGAVNSVNFEEEIDYEYSILHRFVSKNYVVYDQYSDYTEIIVNLFNSLMASFSIKKGQNKIEYLNDFYLYHLVEYGDVREFEKYLKRYNVYEIPYKKLEDQDYQFVNLFMNFTNSSTDELNTLLEENDEYLFEIFKERYNSIFQNFLFFSGILLLKSEDVSRITLGIFKVLENEKLVERYNYESIYNYFIRKNNQIENGLLIQLFLFIAENDGYFDSNKMINLINELRYSKITLNFTGPQFSQILLYLKEKTEQSGDYHMLVTMFEILGSRQKKILSETLNSNLNNGFDRDLCSLMLIYDLIDIDTKGYFNQFIDSIEIANEHPIGRNTHSSQDPASIRYSILDDLFNIAFKYNLCLSDQRFSKFKGVSRYYDWLLDIDHFDYSEFDPYWIAKYNTKYYYAHMKKHEVILKKEIQKHIHLTQDARLKKIFYTIFCYEEQ
ncbi:hypothetical protein B0A80_16890 [Flavobacterium tructae]|uniref:hypothetical protein n=1 Tax=Flavobacterium tructae TaxID=1114873 RepID=UPI000B5C008F|nr:hypothetical protein [Flavobacterium tructae]OXB21472.1 hypothetical protein B0A80_16890 [Flavobacterium tructae]